MKYDLLHPQKKFSLYFSLSKVAEVESQQNSFVKMLFIEDFTETDPKLSPFSRKKLQIWFNLVSTRWALRHWIMLTVKYSKRRRKTSALKAFENAKPQESIPMSYGKERQKTTKKWNVCTLIRLSGIFIHFMAGSLLGKFLAQAKKSKRSERKWDDSCRYTR